MIYDIKNYPYNNLTKIDIVKYRKKVYTNIISAFDIETTNIKEVEQAIMYIWQFAIDNDVIIGRTWGEFKIFVEKLNTILQYPMIVYVHNLSFEFQFLRSILDFTIDDVFLLDRRKILKAKYKNLEFRCSYILSNMSLDNFLKYENVDNKKLMYDYSIERFSDTILTDDELAYCVNDVLGLTQAIKHRMKKDNDTLATIPLTSTGYVRRIAKQKMRGVYLDDLKLNEKTYMLLRECFRGGNTHGSRFYTGEILDNVESFDITSSYPAQQLYNSYPMGKWQPADDKYIDDVLANVYRHKKLAIFRAVFTNLKLKKLWGCPYIPRDKSRNIKFGVYDNGRVLSADFLEISLTNIDLEIILSEYSFDNIIIYDLFYAKSASLPKPWLELNFELFKAKTDLKGKDDYLYTKTKNLLNSIYGMTVEDVGKRNILFDEGIFKIDDSTPLKEILFDNQKFMFRAYSWGVFCTAYARKAFEDGLNCIPSQNFVYGDTDSIKFLSCEHKFNDYNEAIKEKGKRYIYKDQLMGVYDYEGKYDKFVHFGAKKYAYEKDGKLGITISGVGKAKGVEELKEKGGLRALKDGFTFEKSGRTISKYNDYEAEFKYKERLLKTTCNVYIENTTYTLGLTEEYKRLLEDIQFLQVIEDNRDIYLK